MLQIIIAEHLEDRVDVQALSRTCHALHSLTSSPALEAAWLWRWHDDQALFHRCSLSSMPVLRQLVEVHHADVNAQRADGNVANSLLHIACRTGRPELAEFLISSPTINVNLACGVDRMMPLHVACMAGSIHVVRQLLALPQIQVNAATPQGYSSLHIACFEQNVELVEDLLRHPDIDVNLMMVLDDALLPPAAAVNAGRMTPLFLASLKGYAGVVRELLRHPGIQVNGEADEGELTSLDIACAKGQLAVIRELLGHPGLSPGSVNAALRISEALGQTAVVSLLRGHWAGGGR